MSAKTIQKHRSTAFAKQNGKCFYCNSPMWKEDKSKFSKTYKIPESYAGRFQCTAEHLMARQDGGTDQKRNIVAACKFCNMTRHKRPKPMQVDSYKKLVISRISTGRWHPFQLNC